MRLAAFALIALLVCSSALRAQNPPPEVLAKLSELSRTGQKAFRDGKFEDANKAFLGFIKVLPEQERFENYRARAHYYVACGFANLAKSKEALENLDKAMKFGYRAFAQIERDPDLGGIKQNKAFGELIAKYKKIEEELLQKFSFDLKTLDGKPIAKKDFLGKVLIIDVWGTWCPPCRLEIPHFVELQKKYRKQGLEIVGLTVERGGTEEQKAERVKRFIKNYDINYACALADESALLASIPNFEGYPTTLFVGRDGRIRQKVTGYHSLADLEEEIKPLLAEKAPPKKEAKKEENKDKPEKGTEKKAG